MREGRRDGEKERERNNNNNNNKQTKTNKNKQTKKKKGRRGKGMREGRKRREERQRKIIGSNLSQIPAFSVLVFSPTRHFYSYIDKVVTLQVNITCKNKHHKSRNLNFPFSTIFQ